MIAPIREMDYNLIGVISRIIEERPDMVRNLQEMVEWEEGNPSRVAGQYDGWEWGDVHTAPAIINSLVSQTVIDIMSSSRSSTHYRLHSRPDTIAALESLETAPESDKSPIAVEDLFRLVSGHEAHKELLRFAIAAPRPVHCILFGPPASGKSLILGDIGRLPGAEYYLGSTTSKAGLVGLLLQVKPRFLVLDELDKMEARDMSPLLTLMETGTVTRLQHGIQERVEMDTKVFAGANGIGTISAPILSRFAKLEVQAYTKAEFLKVATDVLIAREGQGPTVAELIATEVAEFSADVRDAARIARLANGNPVVVRSLVQSLLAKPGVTRLRR